MLITASCLFVTQVASADLSPPSDEDQPSSKSVRFSFKIHGLTTDRVVFAYPCGRSFAGQPDKLTLVENEKEIAVVSSSYCPLYSMSKAAYDEWEKTYRPLPSGPDPLLEELASKATKCEGGPSPVFDLPTSDSRDALVEELDVKTLDDTTCAFESRGTGAPADSGGCSVGGSAKTAAPWFIALAVPIIVLGSRRRRKA